MAAWLMAVYFNGMNQSETINYTKAIINSGEKINWKNLDGFIIDKHSTGGVGDKVSVALAPILAACGCYVPMIVGRGLGHTGGTLDKLESIPNYNGMITVDKFKKNVRSVGCSIIGQIPDICPADLKIYSLRDQTSTIVSNPLICGSIMGKKIAECIQVLVLDIKVGNGAFMKTIEDAKKLSSFLHPIAHKNNIKIKTIFSDMNQILGNSAGLYCEILESIEILKGRGPEDLRLLIKSIAIECLEMSGTKNPINKINKAINSGEAFDRFLQMIYSHGSKIKDDQFKEVNKPKYYKKIVADKTGYLSSMDTFSIGMGLVQIGAGRKSINDKLDYTSGIILNRKIGDKICKGDDLAVIFNSKDKKLHDALAIFTKSFKISNTRLDMNDKIIIDCS